MFWGRVSKECTRVVIVVARALIFVLDEAGVDRSVRSYGRSPGTTCDAGTPLEPMRRAGQVFSVYFLSCWRERGTHILCIMYILCGGE